MKNNEFLDNSREEDTKIGTLFYENGRPYRMINGKKIRQLGNQKKDLCINRVRASGMTPSQYLKSLYG